MKFFYLKVYQFGSSDSLLVNKILVINNSNETRHLRSIIKEEVNKKLNGKFQFNADSSEIKNLVRSDGVNMLDILDCPLSSISKELKEMKVTIMPSSSNEVIAEADAPVDLVQQNQIEMVFLPPLFPLTEVLAFQEAYKKRSAVE